MVPSSYVTISIPLQALVTTKWHMLSKAIALHAFIYKYKSSSLKLMVTAHSLTSPCAPAGVLVKFDRDSYMLQATSENFTACISVHGELGKNISVSVTTENEAVRGGRNKNVLFDLAKPQAMTNVCVCVCA